MRSPDIGVLLRGGLGNQMFQYAFGLNAALQRGVPLRLDTRELTRPELEGRLTQKGVLRTFSLAYLPISMGWEDSQSFDKHYRYSKLHAPILGKLMNLSRSSHSRARQVVRESHFEYDPAAVSRVQQGSYLVGYWQSYKYFADIAARVREEFTLPLERLPTETRRLAHEIEDVGAICLNIRRGDYAELAASRNFHGLLDLNYYKSALEEVLSRTDTRSVFLFSDDLRWSSEMFGGNDNIQLVDHKHAGPSFTHYLRLMQQCKAFVIPNSTFGWWSAWLAVGDCSRVVAPLRWFRSHAINTSDLTPPSWVRI